MLKKIWRFIVTQIYWKYFLGKIGHKSIIYAPLFISGASRIDIGNKTQIRDFSRIEVINRPQLGWQATLKIGNNVLIEQGVHIVCQGKITIADNVAIAPYCAIVDTFHPHDFPDSPVPIGNRLPEMETSVYIGEGTFLGIHSVILPNVKIGKKCVIGAGSVVNDDVPDYAVVAGVPAKIISFLA